jgi:hypothetical protein
MTIYKFKNIVDNGDESDIKKGGPAWDFDESKIPIYKDEKGYIYKAYSEKSANILKSYRDHINKVCKRMEKEIDNYDTVDRDRIEVFLDLHNEYLREPSNLPEPFSSIAKRGKTSRYLLSEMPPGGSAIGFAALNKPRLRYIDETAKPIGKDGNLRALYRDVSLNLKEKDLDSLVIHELAHSMANHVRWYDDNHSITDFGRSEDIIKSYW